MEWPEVSTQLGGGMQALTRRCSDENKEHLWGQVLKS